MNHGVEEEILERTFLESKKLFSLPLEDKMKLARKLHRGYTPVFAESLDPHVSSKGFASFFFLIYFFNFIFYFLGKYCFVILD